MPERRIQRMKGEVFRMEKIEIATLGEAKKYLPHLAILQVMMAVNQEHTVTVEDEFRNREFIIKGKIREADE